MILSSIFLILAEIYHLLTLPRRCLTHFTKYEPDNHHYRPITEGVEVKLPEQHVWSWTAPLQQVSLCCSKYSLKPPCLLPADIWDLQTPFYLHYVKLLLLHHLLAWPLPFSSNIRHAQPLPVLLSSQDKSSQSPSERESPCREHTW